MAVSGGDEKRRHPRVNFKTQIKISLEGGGRQIELEGDSKDLSLKGVFVRAGEESLDAGTPCDISIYLTGGIDEIRLAMKGSVVRSNKDGMGIVFDSMDVDTYSHLKNIVYYNSVDDSGEE